METMISYCGLECTKCPAFIARKEDNDELRKKTAAEWSKQFNAPVTPESINCDGCVSEGVHSGYCRMCEIRKCGIEKGINNCAFCDDYGCEKLEKVHQMEPECKKRLDGIRSIR